MIWNMSRIGRQETRYNNLIRTSIQNNAKTVSQISLELAIPSSTAYRIIESMVRQGVIRKTYIIGERRRRVAKYNLKFSEVVQD